jgi:flagellar biosynthetic protein FlhB
MADDQTQDQSQKTEEPTHKKLEEARKKGQGVTSREVNHWFILLGGTILVAAIAPGMMGQMAKSMQPFIERPHTMSTTAADAAGGVGAIAMDILLAMAPMMGLFVVAALAAGFVQRGFNASWEPVKPELKKISPLAGVKRLFALKSFVEFLKGIFKITIVAVIGYLIVVPAIEDELVQLPRKGIDEMMALIYSLVLQLLIGVVAVMSVIAGLDYMYQRFEFMKQMKMTRQEVRDELKQTEGDPQVRARIRQLRHERSRQRMIAAVPEADVVVTNPTHFAVALKYDGGGMEAPSVVAKGADEVARRIREVAEENDVPLVENPPLAQALYASVEVGDEIPFEHYQTVAEVISYVWRLKGKMGQKR